ncbi:MAG: hypothetical protein A3K19_15485 [Lentisphaerae bacterium RIFOXYB12_FULL_65_16]|nr:MAG: hypothetical protein A3K18_26460 [Lentisphaerae bacterium RIFOXYA12_64_32]OGV88502.1 MAG: hypothetical protein A3K19_15485 [Lentisphaerae bacterium RIFOXYB12_FULL_65_16]
MAGSSVLWRYAARGGRFFSRTAVALAVLRCVAGTVVLAVDEPTVKVDMATAEDQDELEISADTMDMDFADRVATFQGNVKVNDSRMTLQSDKMIVTLNSTDELKRIEALGGVVIQEAGTGRRATAGKAVYDVEAGNIVLTEDPRLYDTEKNGSITGATQITYDRKTEKFRVEGQRNEADPSQRPTFKVLIPKDKGKDLEIFGVDKAKKDKEKQGQ